MRLQKSPKFRVNLDRGPAFFAELFPEKIEVVDRITSAPQPSFLCWFWVDLYFD
jgi:hypothetical protein